MIHQTCDFELDNKESRVIRPFISFAYIFNIYVEGLTHSQYVGL